MDLAGKLQIKPSHSVAVINPPPDVLLPTNATDTDNDASTADAVLGFALNSSDLDQLGTVIDAARADRLAWIGYPKGGQLGTDLNRDRLVQAVSALGIQPVRQVSIDATWSALRFRPAAA